MIIRRTCKNSRGLQSIKAKVQKTDVDEKLCGTATLPYFFQKSRRSYLSPVSLSHPLVINNCVCALHFARLSTREKFRLPRNQSFRIISDSSSSRHLCRVLVNAKLGRGETYAILKQLIINTAITCDAPQCVQQRHKVELGRSNYLLRVINYFRDSIPTRLLLIFNHSGLDITTVKRNITNRGIQLFYFSFSSRFRKHRFCFSTARDDLPLLESKI